MTIPLKKTKTTLPACELSLRDYFAGKAMQAYMAGHKSWNKKNIIMYATLCYDMADAMIQLSNQENRDE